MSTSRQTVKASSDTPKTRINKYICESGICSRKAADKFILSGAVAINGKQANLGEKVSADDNVTLHGVVIKPLAASQLIFIALNKPVGVVCTAASSDKRNIIDFVDHPFRIFPIGRLDKDSQGLIFLTNRCDLVDKIMHAGNQHEKQYIVTVNKPITDEFVNGLVNGVPMLGVVTKPCKVEQLSELTFSITLDQGLNRQIRRMCKHFHYSVTKLERVRIMHVQLAELPVGSWRNLSSDESAKMLLELDGSTPTV